MKPVNAATVMAALAAARGAAPGVPAGPATMEGAFTAVLAQHLSGELPNAEVPVVGPETDDAPANADVVVIDPSAVRAPVPVAPPMAMAALVAAPAQLAGDAAVAVTTSTSGGETLRRASGDPAAREAAPLAGGASAVDSTTQSTMQAQGAVERRAAGRQSPAAVRAAIAAVTGGVEQSIGGTSTRDFASDIARAGSVVPTRSGAGTAGQAADQSSEAAARGDMRRDGAMRAARTVASAERQSIVSQRYGAAPIDAPPMRDGSTDARALPTAQAARGTTTVTRASEPGVPSLSPAVPRDGLVRVVDAAAPASTPEAAPVREIAPRGEPARGVVTSLRSDTAAPVATGIPRADAGRDRVESPTQPTASSVREAAARQPMAATVIERAAAAAPVDRAITLANRPSVAVEHPEAIPAPSDLAHVTPLAHESEIAPTRIARDVPTQRETDAPDAAPVPSPSSDTPDSPAPDRAVLTPRAPSTAAPAPAALASAPTSDRAVSALLATDAQSPATPLATSTVTPASLASAPTSERPVSGPLSTDAASLVAPLATNGGAATTAAPATTPSTPVVAAPVTSAPPRDLDDAAPDADRVAPRDGSAAPRGSAHAAPHADVARVLDVSRGDTDRGADDRARRDRDADVPPAPLAAAAPRTERAADPEIARPEPVASARGIAEQIAERLSLLRGRGRHEISLALEPAELGTVHVSARMEGKHVTLEIRAELAEARDLLQQALPQLRESLGLSGLVAGRVTVHLGLDASARDFSGRHPQGFPFEALFPDAPRAAAPAVPTARRGLSAGAFDFWV